MNIHTCTAVQCAETCRRRQRTCKPGLPRGDPKTSRQSPRTVSACNLQGQKGKGTNNALDLDTHCRERHGEA
eukprot:4698419-Alexandrium_andersonii.AAC.1